MLVPVLGDRDTNTKMPADPPDYSLYLVTDSTKEILGDKDLVAVVKDAIEGGGLILPSFIPSHRRG